MSDRPLFAILPKPLKSGDEVIIKGQLMEEPNEFSINFTLDRCGLPNDVSLHFKVDFRANEIVFNSKEDGLWSPEETKIENEYFDETKRCHFIPDEPFKILFHFFGNQVIVYTLDEFDEGQLSRNFIQEYSLGPEINNIQTVQVWGDVSKIDELTFKYF